MSWDEQLNEIRRSTTFDSIIGSDILFSEDAPDYVFRNGPLPDLGFILRESQPSLNQIVFSINFVVRWTVSDSRTGLGPADNIDSTIQVRASTLINSNGEAIAMVLTSYGIRPDLHRSILDRICMESRSMMANTSNIPRLTYMVAVEILNGLLVSVRQMFPLEEISHALGIHAAIRRIRLHDHKPVEVRANALKRIIYVSNTEEAASGDCPICLREFELGTELIEVPCSHVFHGGCIEEWIRRTPTTPTCPICRRGIS